MEEAWPVVWWDAQRDRERGEMTAYDAVPYPGQAFPQTHPDRLATLAHLFGLTAPRVETCRVLELGCGEGTNLVPMAFVLPGATFVGIDLAASAVAAGREMVGALGLGNIELRTMDLMELEVGNGEYDYIIAHGLYSWVPAPVRERILQLCARALAPRGVAYVSYNALPGGHLRRMAREVLLFGAAGTGGARRDTSEVAAQATALLSLVAQAAGPGDAYGVAMREEAERVGRRDPAVLFHDDLAEVYEPFSIASFAADAGANGLQFLAEANFHEMQDGGLPPGAMEAIAELAGGDVVRHEQLRDFIKGRRFRQTLLCRAGVSLSRPADATRVCDLHVAAPVRRVGGEASLGAGAAVSFRGHLPDASLTTDLPVAKAALLALGAIWPRAVSFGDLAREARRLVGVDEGKSEEAIGALAEILLAAFATGLISLHVTPPPAAQSAGVKPIASALAREQAARGDYVTTLLHTVVRIEDATARGLLRLLDGTRDREALIATLVGAGAGAGPDGEGIREALERNLERLASMGLLAG